MRFYREESTATLFNSWCKRPAGNSKYVIHTLFVCSKYTLDRDPRGLLITLQPSSYSGVYNLSARVNSTRMCLPRLDSTSNINHDSSSTRGRGSKTVQQQHRQEEKAHQQNNTRNQKQQQQVAMTKNYITENGIRKQNPSHVTAVPFTNQATALAVVPAPAVDDEEIVVVATPVYEAAIAEYHDEVEPEIFVEGDTHGLDQLNQVFAKYEVPG